MARHEAADAEPPVVPEPLADAVLPDAMVDDEQPAPMVLFDFDGVLVHGDLFAQFLRERLRRQYWRLLVALPLMPLLAMTWLVPPARPLVIAFAIRLALFGSGIDGLRRTIDRWARARARRPGTFIRDGVRALRRHVADGAHVAIVTGCEVSLAAAMLDEIALGDIAVVGSELGSGWSGARLSWHNVGRRKVRKLSRLGIIAPWAIAYSDSSRDTPLLSGAVQPVLVNADGKLGRRMERRLGRPLGRVDWR